MSAQSSRHRTAVFFLTDDAGLLRLARSILEPVCAVIGGPSLRDDADIRVESLEVVMVDIESVDHDALAMVRRVCPNAQPIVLSRELRELDRVAILDADADYLACPFQAHDLAARVRVAALKRFRATGRARVYCHGALAFDLFNRRLTIDGRPIGLTPSELALLSLLANELGAVAAHTRLLAGLGLAISQNGRKTLRSFVCRLRRKIERDPLHPQILLAVAGVGYRLALPSAAGPTRESAKWAAPLANPV